MTEVTAGAMETMSRDQMAAVERNAASRCRDYLGFYMDFPTAGNFDLLVEQLRTYQSAWMNGRVREGGA